MPSAIGTRAPWLGRLAVSDLVDIGHGVKAWECQISRRFAGTSISLAAGFGKANQGRGFLQPWRRFLRGLMRRPDSTKEVYYAVL